MKKKYVFLVFFLLSLFSPLSFSSQDIENSIKENLTKETNKLLKIAEEIKENPEMERSKMYLLIDDALKETFAFRRMAGRIMGKYARFSSPQERNKFVDNFKQKLFDSYINSLITSEKVDVEIKDVRLLKQNMKRGVVDMEITTSDGERFFINYSIFNNNENWMVENVIVEGVNLGLTFRDSFYQEMEKNRNDLSKTINTWNVNIKTD